MEGEGKQGSVSLSRLASPPFSQTLTAHFAKQALLHYTFAALSGYAPASMTVGYRHWVGIGTKQSCKDAHGWYKAAADQGAPPLP